MGGTDLGEGALGEDAAEVALAAGGRTGGTRPVMDVWGRTYMSRQVFPQAPSPTITSFRRISAMVRCVGRVLGDRVVVGGCCGREVSRRDERGGGGSCGEEAAERLQGCCVARHMGHAPGRAATAAELAWLRRGTAQHRQAGCDAGSTYWSRRRVGAGAGDGAWCRGRRVK